MIAALVIALGLVLRLAYVLFWPQQPVTFDAAGYDEIARTFLATGSYPPYGRAPVYPALLALLYAAFGHSYTVVRVVQAVIVSLTAIVTYALARELAGKRPATLAAGLVSFYPGFFGYAGLLLTETLFTLLLALTAIGLVRVFHRDRLVWAYLTGAVIGAAALCRGETLGLVPFAFFGLLAVCGPRPALRKTTAIVAGTVLVLAPWFGRNYLQRGDAVSASAGFGIGPTVWLSTYPGDWQEWYPERDPLRSLLVQARTPEEANRVLLREGIRNALRYPLTYAELCGKRFGRFWMGGHSNTFAGLEMSMAAAAAGAGRAFAVKLALLVLNLSLLAIAAIAVIRRRHEWRGMLPLLLPIIYINALHVVLFSTSRYQIPVMPLVLTAAALALSGPATLASRRGGPAVARA